MSDAIVYSDQYPQGKLTEIAVPPPGTAVFAYDNATGKVKSAAQVKGPVR